MDETLDLTGQEVLESIPQVQQSRVSDSTDSKN